MNMKERRTKRCEEYVITKQANKAQNLITVDETNEENKD